MSYDLKRIDIDQLDLDPHNPRLPAYVERKQPEMLEFLAKSSSIEELMSAISENDFFEAEALIAIKGSDRYIVVEGNRRLTALKLLNGAQFEGIQSRLKEIQENAPYRPREVPVAVYETRQEILNYLGNRHIAGVKPWGALAKARYVRQLFDATDSALSFSDRCRAVAKVIGSRRDFISKSMRAYDVYALAESNNFFDLPLDERDIKFSIISTSIDYSGFQNFIFGTSDEDTSDQPPDKNAVKDIFSWLFVRDKSGKTRIGESRNINKLSQIMLNDEALKQFRSGATIQQAYLKTTGVSDDFDSLCFEIQNSLREANAIVADVEKTESREQLATSIFRQARQLENAFRDS